MTKRTWRDAAKDRIAQALDEGAQQGLTGKELRAYVNSRYPFGERGYHPYKIWCDEMRRTFEPERFAAKAKSAAIDTAQAERQHLIDAGQTEMFE